MDCWQPEAAGGGIGMAPAGGGIGIEHSLDEVVPLAAARTAPVAATAAVETIEERWVESCSVFRKVSRKRLNDKLDEEEALLGLLQCLFTWDCCCELLGILVAILLLLLLWKSSQSVRMNKCCNGCLEDMDLSVQVD